MTIPTNLTEIKEAYSVADVNASLAAGWRLIAVSPRHSMGPAYTMGRVDSDQKSTRQLASEKSRGL